MKATRKERAGRLLCAIVCLSQFWSSVAAAKPNDINRDGSFRHLNHYTVTNEIGDRYGLEKRAKGDAADFYLAQRHDGRMHVMPMGPLGGWCVSLEGRQSLILVHVDDDGPLAKAKLQQWDEIEKINGRSLPALNAAFNSGEGPAVVLGEEIDRSEGRRDGLIQLDLRRGNKTSRMRLKLPTRGSFTKTFPNNCRKAAALQADAARQLAEKQGRNGSWGPLYTTPLAGLALLSVGDPAYQPNIRKAAEYLCAIYRGDIEYTYAKTGTWPLTLSIIFLAEYVGATGDQDVLPILQNMSDRMGTEFMTPYGGFGNFSPRENFDYGTYGRKNFGSTAMMALLGWALSRRVGCLVNRDLEENAYRLVRGTDDIPKYCAVDYGGRLINAKGLTDNTFPTATLALYLGTNKHDDQIRERLVQTLARYHKDFPYIHATPSHGIIFGHWAMQRFRPKNLQDYHNYQKWYLSLSRLPDGKFEYVAPKRARVVIPGGGGGWNGDVSLGADKLALIHAITLTAGDRRNLMLLGQKRLCWYGDASIETYRRTISAFRQQRLRDGLETAKTLFGDGKRVEAVQLLENMHAERTTRDSEAAKLLASARKNKHWSSITTAMKEQEAMAFYRFAEMDDQYHISNNTIKRRKPYLQYVIDTYPNTEAAKLADQYLSTGQPPIPPAPSTPPQSPTDRTRNE